MILQLTTSLKSEIYQIEIGIVGNHQKKLGKYLFKVRYITALLMKIKNLRLQ